MKKWPELADNYSKTLALPQSLSKIFFVSQTQKFMKIFQKNHPPPSPKGHFWGGGILNVVFARFDAACSEKFPKMQNYVCWWVVLSLISFRKFRAGVSYTLKIFSDASRQSPKKFPAIRAGVSYTLKTFSALQK